MENLHEGSTGREYTWDMGADAERRISLKIAFEKKDVDHSGFLDLSEIKSALKSGGIVANEDLVRQILEEMDTNNDGKVDFEEVRGARVRSDAFSSLSLR